jgi:tRNA threonylcarbamoyladenosine biosynthesis protein TsaB
MTSTWILGFDTATRATTVALSRPDGLVLEARDDPPRGERPRHAAKLMPFCAEVLAEAGIGFSELARVAVGTGPGTFTGLRIGVATGRALAQATGRGLVGVSTLHSLALNALAAPARDEPEAVVAVLDARRQEVFAAAWTRDEVEAPRRALIAPAAFAPERLAERLARLDSVSLALGEGALEFRQVLERAGAFVPDDDSELHLVAAANHCRIAEHLPASHPDHVRPEYLRLPDAELARRARAKP